MPDLKISQLPAASTPLAGTELVPVVQGGVTEQTPVQSLLTSTVPSGTANGVMYLNSSKVATTGTALSFDGTKLEVSGTVAGPVTAQVTNLSLDSAAIARLRLDAQGGTWFIDNNRTGGTLTIGNASERMRLDASGNLGIGTTSPSARLHVGTSGGTIQLRLGNNTGSDYWGIGRDNVTTGDLVFQGQTTERMRLDSSGNLGLGVTPNAWSGATAIEVSRSGNALTAFSANNLYIVSNTYFNGTNWIYAATNSANRLQLNGGTYVWDNAASGTAGTTVAFTERMRLDASGNLGLGTTSPSQRLAVRSADNSGATNIARFESNNAAQGVNVRFASVMGDGGNTTFGTLSNHAAIIATNSTEVARFDTSGNFIHQVNGTAPSLSTNSTMSFELTSNTSLKIVVRGTDGVTRSASLTLA